MLRFSASVTHANMSAAGLRMQTVHADEVVSSLMSCIKSVLSCCGRYPSMLTECCSRIIDVLGCYHRGIRNLLHHTKLVSTS